MFGIAKIYLQLIHNTTSCENIVISTYTQIYAHYTQALFNIFTEGTYII